jgi:hypothetical protein
MDTSILKTSYAKSIAYIDTTKKKINHTLTQEGKILIKYDTIVQIQNVDKIIERDVPIEVEVIKYKRDTLFWVLAGWAVICILYFIIKLKI